MHNYTFIKDNFVLGDHFNAGGSSLLNIYNIRPHGGVPLPFLAPSGFQLNANIYLDKELKKNFFKNMV